MTDATGGSRLFFIINPTAHNGRAVRVWELARVYLQQKKVAYAYAFSHSEEHLTELAANAANRGATVVAVGGDGTISRIAGVLAGTNIPLGVIPAGTGNDFIRTFSIPTDPQLACQVVLAGHYEYIDLGFLGERCFCNVAGAGLDAEVAHYANSSLKKSFGPLAYMVSLLKHLISYRPQILSVCIDEQEYSGKAWLVAIANGRYYGNGMQVAPLAQPGDGLFDVIIVGDLHRLNFLRVFPLVYKGGHIHHPAVRIVRGKTVTVHSEDRLAVHADGDIGGTTPISIHLAEKALRLLTPGPNKLNSFANNSL